MEGKKHSEESKRKMSEAKRGKPTWNKGKKLSKEHKERMSRAKMGEKNHNWKGEGISIGKKIKRMFLYRQWRSDVYTRDDYTCQECDIKGGELNVHHKKTFAEILDKYKITTLREAENCAELWDINNGITLCVPCHRKTDTWGKKYNGTFV